MSWPKSTDARHGWRGRLGKPSQIIAPNVDFTLTFFDACVIYSSCKADLRQKMWS